MATRTINSPGVEIRESDLSLIAPQNVGTNFFITGFAQQGPLDEVIQVTSKQELVQIYGVPTTSAERYFHHSIVELLNSPGNVYASRMPYGAANGEGFGSLYSALVYPVRAVTGETGSQTVTTELDQLTGTYVFGEPAHVELTQSQYLSALNGSFDWSTTATNASAYDANLTDWGGAGMIVLNKSQTTINTQYEGFYVGVVDNTNLDPNSDFDSVLATKSVAASGTTAGANYIDIPEGIMQFALSAESNGAQNSISQVMENLTDYNIDGPEDDDLLNVGVFKLRKSIYANEAFKLDFVLEDGIVGSINSYRQELNPLGGPARPFFLENTDENSRNVEILVNPYVSNKFSGDDTLVNGVPQKKSRILTNQLENNADSGLDAGVFTTLAGVMGYADNLYALGAFNATKIKDKEVGSIPLKLDRVLQAVKNDEVFEIDVVVEAGLGTIWSISQAAGTTYYDEFENSSAIRAAVDGLRTSNAVTGDGEDLRNDYATIFNRFQQFVEAPFLGGERGDCVFVADALRHIFVVGSDQKILEDRTKNFTQHIYWALRHQFELENTSYACVYGNWAKIFDPYIGQQVWTPFSAFGAAAMARTDAATFPWFAPAGFTRGLVRYANDIAIQPNQKQRDELYKSNINPVAFFPSQGLVIFGQKTLSRKPSAFDRINVRRLFLALERPTKKASKFFVFEQNTIFTRTRIINTLTPIFERAKNNEGLYDYLLVCDERNNTPEVIDNNELIIDIYLKPTRTAEFILVNFYATRTDANFEELIGPRT